jgi:hypothetical protein
MISDCASMREYHIKVRSRLLGRVLFSLATVPRGHHVAYRSVQAHPTSLHQPTSICGLHDLCRTDQLTAGQAHDALGRALHRADTRPATR